LPLSRRQSVGSCRPSSSAPIMTSTIIPCLRYRDAPRMIEWLCKAFGFERHLVVETARAALLTHS
jgi:hypothetical protein